MLEIAEAIRRPQRADTQKLNAFNPETPCRARQSSAAQDEFPNPNITGIATKKIIVVPCIEQPIGT
jgi:hypothetical protein